MSKPHRRRRDLETMQALVAEIEDRRRTIFLQALHEGNWNSVFDEARFMGAAVEALKAELAASWHELTAALDNGD